MRTAYLTFSGGGRLVSLRLATPRVEARLLMATVAELVHARAADGDAPAIRFEDDSWTWAEYVDAVAVRAAYLTANLTAGAPPHFGVLFDNTPEYAMWLGAAAVTGTRPRRHQPDRVAVRSWRATSRTPTARSS